MDCLPPAPCRSRGRLVKPPRDSRRPEAAELVARAGLPGSREPERAGRERPLLPEDFPVREGGAPARSAGHLRHPPKRTTRKGSRKASCGENARDSSCLPRRFRLGKPFDRPLIISTLQRFSGKSLSHPCGTGQSRGNVLASTCSIIRQRDSRSIPSAWASSPCHEKSLLASRSHAR